MTAITVEQSVLNLGKVGLEDVIANISLIVCGNPSLEQKSRWQVYKFFNSSEFNDQYAQLDPEKKSQFLGALYLTYEGNKATFQPEQFARMLCMFDSYNLENKTTRLSIYYHNKPEIKYDLAAELYADIMNGMIGFDKILPECLGSDIDVEDVPTFLWVGDSYLQTIRSFLENESEITFKTRSEYIFRAAYYLEGIMYKTFTPDDYFKFREHVQYFTKLIHELEGSDSKDKNSLLAYSTGMNWATFVQQIYLAKQHRLKLSPHSAKKQLEILIDESSTRMKLVSDLEILTKIKQAHVTLEREHKKFSVLVRELDAKKNKKRK